GRSVPHMTSLVLGMEAPDFELPDQNGRYLRLASFRGQREVLLFFYPRDETPVCTREVCSFRDQRAEFEARGATLLGISINTVEEHARFARAHNVDYPLLADADGTVARRYGLVGTLNGSPASQRITFRIDRDGRIREIVPLWDAQAPLADVAAHTEQVLAHIPRLLAATGGPNGYEAADPAPRR
ncbi:MAG: peroxiredoxin, partial [Thermoplasmata archaeon]